MVFFGVILSKSSIWAESPLYVAPSSVLNVYYDKICLSTTPA